MPETQTYTALHGSPVPCAWCGAGHTPRIKTGPNADRFCTSACKDKFWNARRRAGAEKISPPPAATGTMGWIEQENTKPAQIATRQAHRQVRANTKLHSVLAELARGARLTRFDAERVCHDHVLNSTIPEIEKRGIIVSRKEIIVPGHRGKPTRCALYWLTSEEIEKATVLLGWRQRPAR